jgi:hypothetical protein
VTQLSLVDTPQALVVHCKRDPFDVYIGRTSGGLGEWGNPFTWKPGTKAQFLVTKDECLPRYEDWVRSQPDLIDRIKAQLAGKRLGCWCRPARGFRGRLLCHGQILAGIANGLEPRLVE